MTYPVVHGVAWPQGPCLDVKNIKITFFKNTNLKYLIQNDKLNGNKFFDNTFF